MRSSRIHNIVKEEIRVPGTLPDTYLETFFLDITPKFLIQERPLIPVCPGGGYHFTSEREAEIVAMQFNAMGYHTAVLRYSCEPAQFPTSLLELSRAVAYLELTPRENAEAFNDCPELCSKTKEWMERQGFSGYIQGVFVQRIGL